MDKTGEILNLSNENVRSPSLHSQSCCNAHQSNQGFPTQTDFKVRVFGVHLRKKEPSRTGKRTSRPFYSDSNL